MNAELMRLPFQKGQLDTLAQSGTQINRKIKEKAVVTGKGTDIINNPSLYNRAKRKLITRKTVYALIDVVKEKGEPERAKAYWNAYHCLNNVVVSDYRLYGKLCKNRFCTVCAAIRKAELINKYYPVISHWQDIYFLTLTVKSCNEEMLKEWIRKTLKAFDLIKERCKKRYQRGKGIKLMGIKSLECNFNPDFKTYNPHFHIIVASKEMAELLKREWLRQWKPRVKTAYIYKYTTPIAQNIRPVRDLTHDLKEIIKYGSKIFTEPDIKKKKEHKLPPMIYARALDNILVAMKRKRIFDRFGFNLPEQPTKKSTIKTVEDFEHWKFFKDASDWINPETGETLTGFIEPLELSYLLNDCINIKTS